MKRFILKSIKSSRRRFYTNKAKKRVKSYENPIRVNYKSSLSIHTVLGKNSNFNGMKIDGSGNVTIGDNFHSGENCRMITQNHNYEGEAIPYDSTYIVKNIVIEDNVWMGTGVTVLGGVTIGEGSILQAGSVIVKDVPKYAIVGGSPAEKFSTRDIEHYEKLKSEGRFN